MATVRLAEARGGKGGEGERALYGYPTLVMRNITRWGLIPDNYDNNNKDTPV